MPKPKNQFQRPSISISDVKKEWRDIPAKDLRPGDVAAGLGRVAEVTTTTKGSVVIVWSNGARSLVRPEDEFYAFVTVTD